MVYHDFSGKLLAQNEWSRVFGVSENFGFYGASWGDGREPETISCIFSQPISFEVELEFDKKKLL